MAKAEKQETQIEEKEDHRQTLLEGQEVKEETAGNEAEGDPGAAEPVEDSGSGDQSTGSASGEPSETAESSKTFLDLVKSEMGWDSDDEGAAAEALIGSYRQLNSEYDKMQARMAEMEELAKAGTEYLKTQREAQAKEEKPAEPEQPEHWWAPPKFELEWVDKYRDVSLGEDGQPVMGWKKNTPREVIEAAEKYQDYMQQWAADLVQKPHEVLPKIIEHEFNRLFEDRIRRRDEDQQLATFAHQVRQSNADWMYTTDSRGNEVLTAEGQMMTEILGEVAANGVTNPQAQWEMAVAMFDYRNRAATAAANQTTTEAQENAATKRQQHLRKGASQGLQNRTGTVPKPEETSQRSQNPHLSPGNQLLQQLRQDGYDV